MDDTLPLDADELMNFSERIEQLPPAEAEWVSRLFNECLRSRLHESELLAGLGRNEDSASDHSELEAQLAQVALDAAEWLKTLWSVGYMGAGSFPAQPRSNFPIIELEDVLKSALFARIRKGKRPLPFPPPTRNGSPWHELVENRIETYDVNAEIVFDTQNVAIAAIIESCAGWNIVEQLHAAREYIVQHRSKGALYRLCFVAGAATLRREAPRWVRNIRYQERGGFQTYTLDWSIDDEQTQAIPLRAATWERAESEAAYWIATQHPQMYGQVRFELIED